ncbi:MAG TPA: enoyl-CoA hydratase-related protein [Acidimicrobiales bacterium]|jgi:enoyl-CoA hydratase
MSYEDIIVSRHGEVEMITLNRPDVRNALRFATYDELERAVRTTTSRCLVITGADPAFCSGDDVRQIMGGGDADHSIEVEPRITPAAEALLSSNVPVIAAVNGAAVGWGMEMALMADIRVASERAKFGELFVLRGLCTDVAGIGRLAGLVGRERAAEMLFTGEVIDADTARSIGLVSRVVAHEQLVPAALEIAARIAVNPPLAVQKIKEGLRRALDPEWDALGMWVSTSLTELFKTDDHREGVKAFLEKRAPNYTGR